MIIMCIFFLRIFRRKQNTVLKDFLIWNVQLYEACVVVVWGGLLLLKTGEIRYLPSLDTQLCWVNLLGSNSVRKYFFSKDLETLLGPQQSFVSMK